MQHCCIISHTNMETQSHEERQEDEVECLQFVFMNDFEDLRKQDSWKVFVNVNLLILTIVFKCYLSHVMYSARLRNR